MVVGSRVERDRLLTHDIVVQLIAEEIERILCTSYEVAMDEWITGDDLYSPSSGMRVFLTHVPQTN